MATGAKYSFIPPQRVKEFFFPNEKEKRIGLCCVIKRSERLKGKYRVEVFSFPILIWRMQKVKTTHIIYIYLFLINMSNSFMLISSILSQGKDEYTHLH